MAEHVLTTSQALQSVYASRFKGHEHDSIRRNDVLLIVERLADHKSMPKKHRMTVPRLISYFKNGKICCRHYIFLIRAALDHYDMEILEFNELPKCARVLSMELYEGTITIRLAASHLGLKPLQLIDHLNGTVPIDGEMARAMTSLNNDIPYEEDCDCDEEVIPDDDDFDDEEE